MMSGPDYIVVGAGSAGCVLVDRLSENDASVLLIEAGGTDRRRWMSMPLAWRDSFKNSGVNWGYHGEAEPFADGRMLPAHRGKVLGGTSSINGMLYARGFPDDYDRWSAEGAIGWSFAEVLPYFRRAETNWRGAGPYHGGEGPLTVSRHCPEPRLHEALATAAVRRGLSHLDDMCAPEREGFGVPDFTMDRRLRASTATAYLSRAKRRPAVSVITEALVRRILIKDGRAVGVEYQRGDRIEQAYAAREVIISAGAFNSPQLLLLSGIGPAEEIAAAGIHPVHDLPGVGRNLQDHHAINLTYRMVPEVSFDRMLRIDRMAWSVARWRLFGTGPAASVPVSGQIFRRIDDASGWPDMQMVITPVAHDARLWFPGWRRGKGDMLAATNVLLRPRSRGSVRLRSPDPSAAPRINFDILSDALDRARFRAMLRYSQSFFATEPVASFLKGAINPDAMLETDESIDAYVRSTAGTAMHPAGTCAMGSGRDSVLDHACRVRGIIGLRVVDAAAMPHVVSGNTNAPVIMIAEKAADMITGRMALRPDHGEGVDRD